MGLQKYNGNKNVQVDYKIALMTSDPFSFRILFLLSVVDTVRKPALKKAHRNEENLKGAGWSKRDGS